MFGDLFIDRGTVAIVLYTSARHLLQADLNTSLPGLVMRLDTTNHAEIRQGDGALRRRPANKGLMAFLGD